MLEFYKVSIDENKAIYRYILEDDETREGYVEFDRHSKDRYASTKPIKKAKDDVFGGWAKLGVNLFDMNQKNEFLDSGMIAWY